MKNKYFDLTVGCHFEKYRDKAPLSSFALLPLSHIRNIKKRNNGRFLWCFSILTFVWVVQLVKQMLMIFLFFINICTIDTINSIDKRNKHKAGTNVSFYFLYTDELTKTCMPPPYRYYKLYYHDETIIPEGFFCLDLQRKKQNYIFDEILFWSIVSHLEERSEVWHWT
jgi:hypothetical protein